MTAIAPSKVCRVRPIPGAERPQFGAMQMLARFDLAHGPIVLRDCALVATPNGVLAVWPPKCGRDDEGERRIKFAPRYSAKVAEHVQHLIDRMFGDPEPAPCGGGEG